MSDLSQESPLWREWAESRHSVQQMREELDSLRAELEIARKDAERYRWLRSCGADFDYLSVFYSRGALVAEFLDAAIDNARGGK